VRVACSLPARVLATLEPFDDEALEPFDDEALEPFDDEALEPFDEEALEPFDEEAAEPGADAASARGARGGGERCVEVLQCAVVTLRAAAPAGALEGGRDSA